MSELPRGWVETTLGDIVSLRAEKIDPSTVPEAPFISLEDIQPHTSEILRVGKAADVRSAVARFRSGDVLYSRLRPYLNKVTIPDFDGVASAEILPLEALEGVDPEFVRRRLMSDEFLNYAALIDKGDRPRVSFQDIAKFPIGLPPSAEQKRIVAVVEALTSRTARARKEISRIASLLPRYKQRLLELGFSGELTKDWRGKGESRPGEMKPLKELAVDLRYGTSRKSYTEPRGVAVLRIPNVSAGRLDLDQLKYSELPSRELSKLALHSGDILVIRSNGTLDLVGRAAIVGEEAEGMAYAGYLIRIRPRTELILPRYLALMLQAPATRLNIEAVARSTNGIHNINAQELGSLAIPVFGIAEQTEIVRRIESSFTLLDNVVTRGTASTDLLAKLDAAILDSAFRGELAPHDPNDEPADVLLARINANRAPPRRRRASRASPTASEPRELRVIMMNLERVLAEAPDWLPAQAVAERCGISADAPTEDIERFYSQLRELDKDGKLETQVVTDEHGKKLYDSLRLKAA